MSVSLWETLFLLERYFMKENLPALLSSSFPTFIFFTVLAMAYRFCPKALTPNLLSNKHLALTLLILFTMHIIPLALIIHWIL